MKWVASIIVTCTLAQNPINHGNHWCHGTARRSGGFSQCAWTILISATHRHWASNFVTSAMSAKKMCWVWGASRRHWRPAKELRKSNVLKSRKNVLMLSHYLMSRESRLRMVAALRRVTRAPRRVFWPRNSKKAWERSEQIMSNW